MEIILINDGSTDNSHNICEKYTQEHKNIVVINKKNEGAAQARNNGMSIAKGEYILFIDSDDILQSATEKKTLAFLFNHAKITNSDVLCFNYSRNANLKPAINSKYSEVSNIAVLINENIFTSSPCTKLIKKSILTKNKIDFIKGTLSEDILFNASLINVPNVKITFINNVFYFYRVREGSITRSISEKHILDLIDIIDELAQSKNKFVLGYAGFQYATLLINVNLCKEKLDVSIWKKVAKNKELLGYNKSKTIACINILSKIIGVKLTSKCMCFVFNMRNV